MIQTTIEVSKIDDAVYESESALTVYQSYSGRGMYGDTCFGLVGDMRALLKFFIQLAQEDEELAGDLANHVSTDNMGYDMIYYFPGFTLEGESVRQDEDY